MASTYYSFLVRLWTSDNNDHSSWRISLENPESGEKHNFADPQEFLEFFQNLMQVRMKSMNDSDE